MELSNQFYLYSPDFNYRRLAIIKKNEKTGKFSELSKTQFKMMNAFDFIGCIPIWGNCSGLIRLSFAIFDYYRLANWKPLEQTKLEETPIVKSSKSKVLGFSSQQLSDTDIRMARLSKLDSLPALSSDGSKCEKLNIETIKKDPLHLTTSPLLKHHPFDEIKKQYSRIIKRNITIALIEMIPVIGSIMMIAYRIFLYKNQEIQIRTDLEKTPILNEDQDVTPPLAPKVSSQSLKRPKQRIATLKTINHEPLINFDEIFKNSEKNINKRIFGEINSIVVHYTDTQVMSKPMKSYTNSLIGDLI
ncbi:MAG: hypothetical protein ACH350_07930 [Parachlamydiaceae bacterium]